MKFNEVVGSTFGGLGDIFLNFVGIRPKPGDDWADNEIDVGLGLLWGEWVIECGFNLRDDSLRDGEDGAEVETLEDWFNKTDFKREV